MSVNRRHQIAQEVIRAYIERWGVRVLDGRLSEHRYDKDELHAPRLAVAGIALASFRAHASAQGDETVYADGYSAIDVTRRAIYWPCTACDPYYLLHEFAHLVYALYTGLPVGWQDENGALAAIEYLSVRYLGYLGRDSGHVSLDDWVDWRHYTGDELGDDKDIDRTARLFVDEVTPWLFYSTAEGYKPTFLLPNGDLYMVDEGDD